MALSRHPGRPRFLLLLLVLTSITVITLDFRGQGSGAVATVREAAADALAPVRAAASAVATPVGNLWNGVTRYDDLERENAALRDRLRELDDDAVAAEDARRQLRELQELNDLASVADIPAVTARVVSAPVSNFDLTVELDKGRSDGIEEDMPVVTGAGLVGRVIQASDDRSVVRLLTDLQSSVGVRLSSSGDVAVANGRGRNRDLSVDLVDAGVAVEEGEAVVTSGVAASIYPPSIPVGRITEGRAADDPDDKVVTVGPAADLTRLQYVRVLQWRQAP